MVSAAALCRRPVIAFRGDSDQLPWLSCHDYDAVNESAVAAFEFEDFSGSLFPSFTVLASVVFHPGPGGRFGFHVAVYYFSGTRLLPRSSG